MTAFTFTIRTLERGDTAGHAIICLDDRYATVVWSHRPVPDGRFASPTQWKALHTELSDTLPATPLGGQSTIVQVLLGFRFSRYTIQYVSAEPIVAEPQDVAVCLDQRLRLSRVP